MNTSVNKRVPYTYTSSSSSTGYTPSYTTHNTMSRHSTNGTDDVRATLFASSSSRAPPSSSTTTSSHTTLNNNSSKYHNERSESLFEQQNNDLTDQLHEKVTRLKQ